jgi:hypothetical protein
MKFNWVKGFVGECESGLRLGRYGVCRPSTGNAPSKKGWLVYADGDVIGVYDEPLADVKKRVEGWVYEGL